MRRVAAARAMRAAACCLIAAASAQLPPWPATWQLNQSTIIMPCNSSGFISPQSLGGTWSLLSIDWSTQKAQWALAKPMDCEERLVDEVSRQLSYSPSSRLFAYRNFIKALPWFSTVREKLVDPAYARWFLPFGPPTNGSGWSVPACDDNYAPPRCSLLYHDQMQVPGYPTGDGVCAPPGCDVGSEYLFDMRALNVSVNGQTLENWFLEEYIFSSATGIGNENISGLYLDDYWTTAGPSEMDPHAVEDMGLSPADVAAIGAAFQGLSARVYAAILARGKFAWNLFFDNGVDCPMPLVTRDNCALDLRSMCTQFSPAQTRAILYGFSPGSCRGTDPANLTQVDQDVVNFQLIRGPYGWIGNGWLGCSTAYERPAIFDADFGDPVDVLCSETAPGSGVFRREFARATVQMNCSAWAPSIEWK